MAHPINYAIKNLALKIQELGEPTQVILTDDHKLLLGFENGSNLQLHQDEIEYQAIDFLSSEIENIKN